MVLDVSVVKSIAMGLKLFKPISDALITSLVVVFPFEENLSHFEIYQKSTMHNASLVYMKRASKLVPTRDLSGKGKKKGGETEGR